MPELGETEVLKRAKRYSAEVQKLSRPQQLMWFGKKLGVSEPVLLRLVGYSPQSARAQLAAGRSAEELAAQKPVGTVWATELFRELVSQNSYDLSKVAASFQPQATDLSTVMRRPVRAKASTLFRRVQHGGPRVYSDLTELIRLIHAAGERYDLPRKARPGSLKGGIAKRRTGKSTLYKKSPNAPLG